MDINYINLVDLKDVSKKNDLILIIVKEENQVFKMMKAQVLKIQPLYKDFKYFIIDEVSASMFFNKEFYVFPQVVITRKDNLIGCIRGFRKTNAITSLIDLNF